MIEAIRMYAADHDGKLTTTLADITSVPIPDDPLTGKPFVYELTGETAILRPAFPATSEAFDNWRYELTMAK